MIVGYSIIMDIEVAVLHVVAGLHPNAGGPSQTVVRLTDALAGQTGIRIMLLSQSLGAAPVVPSRNPAVSRLVPTTGSRIALQLGLPLRRSLVSKARVATPDLLHSHGLWTAANHWTARLARRASIPLIIQPRGMLEPWALAYRSWKKRLALLLYQRPDLASAVLLVATAEQEAENFRSLGLRQPIAIIPNGVDLPEWRDQPYPKSSPRTILFLSRIHPVKGLLNLVQAWRIVRPADWRIIIAGPDEGGHQRVVESAIQQAGLQDIFVFAGAVYGDEKEALYRSAEVFVLPTYTENFGLVVAEALAFGIPVITTKGAPWQGLHIHGCGWWIDIGVEPLAAGLREATNLPPDTLRDMGRRGRAFVEQNFGWAGIAAQMLSVYRWVLGRGDRPDCVTRD